MEQEFRGLSTELYVSPHHPAGSENLLRAVVELDESNLNHEKLQNLIVLLPTSSELQMVKQYSGEHTALTLHIVIPMRICIIQSCVCPGSLVR
jgi:hypothetical protein